MFSLLELLLVDTDNGWFIILLCHPIGGLVIIHMHAIDTFFSILYRFSPITYELKWQRFPDVSIYLCIHYCIYIVGAVCVQTNMCVLYG